jgi:hypothetical protein
MEDMWTNLLGSPMGQAIDSAHRPECTTGHGIGPIKDLVLLRRRRACDAEQSEGRPGGARRRFRLCPPGRQTDPVLVR